MTIWGGATTRKQLQQTISRLQMLNEAPELPKENILVSRIDSTRRLGISRENEIASNLAFLFAASDDSLKVMTVSRRTSQWRTNHHANRIKHGRSLSSDRWTEEACQDFGASCTARLVGIRPGSGTQLIPSCRGSKARRPEGRSSTDCCVRPLSDSITTTITTW
jgi:hypothetical protein